MKRYAWQAWMALVTVGAVAGLVGIVSPKIAWAHGGDDSHDHVAEMQAAIPPEEMLKIRAAAEGGDAAAMGMLGEMYHNGMGVERDLKTAFFWFREGAEKGDKFSMLYLARYFMGEFPALGLKKDYDAAEALLLPVAREEDGMAMATMGTLLYARVRAGETGRLPEATWWYNRATGGEWDENYVPPPLKKLLEQEAADEGNASVEDVDADVDVAAGDDVGSDSDADGLGAGNADGSAALQNENAGEVSADDGLDSVGGDAVKEGVECESGACERGEREESGARMPLEREPVAVGVDGDAAEGAAAIDGDKSSDAGRLTKPEVVEKTENAVAIRGVPDAGGGDGYGVVNSQAAAGVLPDVEAGIKATPVENSAGAGSDGVGGGEDVSLRNGNAGMGPGFAGGDSSAGEGGAENVNMEQGEAPEQ